MSQLQETTPQDQLYSNTIFQLAAQYLWKAYIMSAPAQTHRAVSREQLSKGQLSQQQYWNQFAHCSHGGMNLYSCE